MKHLIVCIVMMVSLVSQTVLASCNPKDIKKDTSTGSYIYPVDCHVEFGQLKQDEEERKKQISHLKESIKLKDLAIDTSNSRIELWQNTTYKMEDRLLKIERNNDRMKWIYFGLGILVMTGATYGASQLNK